MAGGIPGNAELDCAIFQVSNQNRYEAIACSKGKTELVASGSLNQLAVHLQDAKKFQSTSSSGTFKIQLPGNLKGSSWFTKSTLARFLHIANSSEFPKSANATLNEMSQLEDTRKFHLSLYSKQNHVGGGLAEGFSGSMAQQANNGIQSSESTKNELLRALDLRLVTLKKEMVALLNRAAGSNLTRKEIADISDFVENFGTTDSRSWLLKCLSVLLDCNPSDPSTEPSGISLDMIEKGKERLQDCETTSEMDIQKHVADSISPAKLAQVERHSSTESDESAEPSDEEQTVVERSRPLVRSASPRRSASPMRRVQIGRSGSRRSTSIAIKSLSYFPARERIPLDKDADEEDNYDRETDQPAKKADSTVRRMSVQDAIHLFETKQKDENVDIQKKKAAGLIGTTKSVLRRWSAGMGDSLTHQSQENIANDTSQGSSDDMVHETEKTVAEVKMALDIPQTDMVPSALGTSRADTHDAISSEVDRIASPSPSFSTVPVKSEHEELETADRATATVEWNLQKEAELNQMLMKMMESKPGKYKGANIGGAELDSSNEQKGGFYSQYKEKRDAKLQAEKGGRKTVKDAHFKVLKQTLEQSKAVMSPKVSSITEKRNSPVPQRARRNSSPPVLPKKEVSTTPVTKKTSPKPSQASATRSARSSGPLTKANSSQKGKSTPGTLSTSTPPSRQKTPTTPSSSRPSSRAEGSLQQSKTKKESTTVAKPAIKVQEEKKTKAVTKTSRVVKAKSSPASEEKSSLTSKPSLYSKVTKKSSVVPLETKPLKKATGTSCSVGPVVAKSKAQLGESSKDSGSLAQAEEKESPVTTESTTKVLEADLAQPANDVDENLEISLHNDLNIETTEKPDSSLAATETALSESVEPPTNEVQPDEDMGISSAAWVEVEHQEVAQVSENGLVANEIIPEIAPAPSSSPRIRHSLSQMLQADCNEPEIIEWGNAENPPALVFQKDSPKGFKRLLKFARKNKGDNNASPSVLSEAEDETEELKGANSKNGDNGNSSKSAFDGHKTTQSTGSSLSSATSTRASRSFFSLSTFRSNKSNETRLR